jgi:hypothetical protein
MVVAIVGALGPATWAAASKTTTALHPDNPICAPLPVSIEGSLPCRSGG